tara:strand:+ start:4788 stop:5336 length:549 start_codon:yes stop_codon:yes gene_type:complete
MLLLIGGGSSVGKTTASKVLAAGLSLPHVQLDELLNSPDFDKLFDAHSPGFWDQQPAALVELLIAKGDAALAGLPRWLGQHSDARGILLEGEGIQPSFLSDLGDLPAIRMVFIVELDATVLRATLTSRSKSFRTLSSMQQDTIVETNRLYNEWIAKEAATHNQLCIASQPWASLPARLLRSL